MTRVTKVVAGLGVGAGVAAVTGVAALAREQGRVIDSTAKFARMIGVSTESLVGLRHAASLSGVAANTFDTALQRMTRRTAEAAQGTGEVSRRHGCRGVCLFSRTKRGLRITPCCKHFPTDGSR